MKFQEARKALEEKRSACFQYAMRARGGAVDGVVLRLRMRTYPANDPLYNLDPDETRILELSQIRFNQRTFTWDQDYDGWVENIGLEATLESAEWDVDLLSAFE